MDATVTDSGRRSRRMADLLWGPPRFVFYVLLTIPALWLLWECTLPGGPANSAFIVFPIFFLAGVTWVVKLVYMAVRRGRSDAPGRVRWFLVAPLGAAIAAALVATNVLVEARFHFDRGAFDKAAAAIRPAANPTRMTGVPWKEHSVGSYTITQVYRLGDALIFYEKHGNFLDDAGFAYLPRGPAKIRGNGGWEDPQFRHLEGQWYSWTASW